MTSVTVAGGSFDVPRRAAKKKAAKDTAKRDRLVRYGIGLSIAGILAADTFVLNGMLRHAAGGVADVLLDPPSSAAATVAPDSAAGQGFASMNVPADRPMGSSGRTFGKWTNPAALSSVSAAEAPAFGLPDLGGAVTGPVLGPTDANGGAGGGGTENPGNDDGRYIPGPDVPVVPTVFQQLAEIVGDVPVVGQFAPVIEQAGTLFEENSGSDAPSAVTPVDAVVDTVDPVVDVVVEPVAASTGSVPAGDLLP